jgi:outer membrane protein
VPRKAWRVRPGSRRDLEARHPALIAGSAQVESIRAQIDGVKAAGLPSLAFNTSYFLNGRPGNVQGNVRSNERYLGLTLTIPLFEGFGRGYKVAQEEAQLEGELAKLELTTANIRREVIKSREGLRSQGVSLQASGDFLAAASESFRAAQARFGAGVADIVELLTAQKELANAKQEHLQALVDWRVASWKLSSSLGQLNIGMLEAMPEAEPAAQTVQPRIYAKSNGS